MDHWRVSFIVFGLLGLAVALQALARPTSAAIVDQGALQRCQALTSIDFSTLEEAPSKISSARHIDSAQEILNDLPDLAMMPSQVITVLRKSLDQMQPMCRVTGYVAPNVGFLLVLPDARWNGKFLHLGCSGWCGDFRWFAASCALHPNYACIGTDMGHEGQGGLWLRNNLQGQIDFSHRATHVVTIAGRAIIERYYGRAPQKSYFVGCSTGGYQGLMEAQRYPWDFNGIIAGAPDLDEADLAVRGIWAKRHYLGIDGRPLLTDTDIQLIHKSALAQCDLDDALKDGIISDPAHCTFDPHELLCRSGRENDCLSVSQVQAVKSIYGAPTTSSGERLSTRGVLPGSELNWADNFAHVWGESYFRDLAILGPKDPEWTYLDFDFDRDYARSGAGVMFANTNPDLRKFKASGGKLIVYQGGNDAGEIPGAIIDYYETVERTMGGAPATQEFFRFFMVPGMNHCGGGEGAFAFDYLGYLERWVEHAQPPDSLIGSHIDGLGEYGWFFLKYPLQPDVNVTLTRPVYPYPKFPRYSGKGDPRRAESFVPTVSPQSVSAAVAP